MERSSGQQPPPTFPPPYSHQDMHRGGIWEVGAQRSDPPQTAPSVLNAPAQPRLIKPIPALCSDRSFPRKQQKKYRTAAATLLAAGKTAAFTHGAIAAKAPSDGSSLLWHAALTVERRPWHRHRHQFLGLSAACKAHSLRFERLRRERSVAAAIG